MVVFSFYKTPKLHGLHKTSKPDFSFHKSEVHRRSTPMLPQVQKPPGEQPRASQTILGEKPSFSTPCFKIASAHHRRFLH